MTDTVTYIKGKVIYKLQKPALFIKYLTWTHFTILPHVMGEEEVVAIDTLKPLAGNNFLYLECWNILSTHTDILQ